MNPLTQLPPAQNEDARPDDVPPARPLARPKGSPPENTLPPANTRPESRGLPREADLLPADHARHEAQGMLVGGNSLDPGHRAADAHTRSAGVDLDQAHSSVDPHLGSGPVVPGQKESATHSFQAGEDLALQLAAASLDDIEKTRMATGLRIGAMDREGLGDTPMVAQAQALHDALLITEKQATKDLERAIKQHRYGPWIASMRGVGPKQGARLIAAIGDPYWNTLDDRPRRGPAELWAYCGFAPGQRRQRGVKSNWNAQGKMRAFLCAEAAVKAGVRKGEGADDTDGYDVEHREAISPLGQTYLAARANWAHHDVSDGHKHNHALRLVAKAILKDLWSEGRRLSEEIGR